MTLDTAALTHSCNVVRREIQEEIPDLVLVFIVHNTGGRMRALDQRASEIMEHPAGMSIFPLLGKMATAGDDRHDLAGMVFGEHKKFMGLVRRRTALGVIFINADVFDDLTEAKLEAYHQAWHAISLLQHIKEDQAELYTETHGILRAKHTLVTLARQNLLADVFAAVMVRGQGHKNALGALAYSRSLSTLKAVPGYKAELYPYPIAADAALLVYEEMKDALSKPVALAIEVAREIDMTYDDAALRHWWEFANAAQEMAWLGVDKTKILSAAIYTSEDPYVRSTAYLAAEALNMEPAPLHDLVFYNPFTDPEVNERQHNKACEESFQRLMQDVVMNFNEHIFGDEIRVQNARLMEGFPVGWCAHALKAAADAFIESRTRDENPAEAAAQVFHAAQKRISCESLRGLSRAIMNRRREDEPVTPDIVAAYCRDKDVLAPVTAIFDAA